MFMKVVTVLLGFAAFAAARNLYVSQNKESPVITLNSPEGSKVRGLQYQSWEKTDYYGFLDIPYAETTAGQNRFREPVPKAAWDGIFNATTNTKTCPQLADSGSEDCLILNVYTPNLNGDSESKKLPVLLYIHGGGFMSGKAADYNPQYFMDEGIVVVTINYRLGIFGFLNTDDDVILPNLGLRDQRLAIEWTHKNIENFGGDPNNIKIAGESAGAASVGWHLLGKREVLFSGAILASGSSLCPFAYQVNSRQNAFDVGKVVNSGFNSSSSLELLDLLRSATAQQLIDAGDHNLVNIRFSTTTDKDFSEAPTDDVDNGRIASVPTLFGFNSEEMLSLLSQEVIEYELPIVEDLGAYLRDVYKYNFLDGTAEIAGVEFKKLYTNTTFNEKSVVTLLSDIAFFAPISRHVESAARYVEDTYMYRLSYKYSYSPPSPVPGMTGVGHGTDLPLVWSIEPLSADDIAMGRNMVKLWSNFIRSGKPSTDDSWPPVKEGSLTYMDLDLQQNTLETNPRHYKQIKAIVDQYLKKPIITY